MNFRFRAFGLHLLGSVCALTLILGSFWLGWYRWPGWYLSGVVEVVAIVLMVDIAIGPTLTLVIASSSKPARVLARDISVIVAVQLIALGYGAVTLWTGRPLYYAFSVNSLQLVQASDLKADEIARGRQENPQLAPHWYDRPRWVWAPLPDDPAKAAQIAEGTLFGGGDVTQMPRYFKPWALGLPELRKHLATVGSLRYFSGAEKQRLSSRIARLGLPVDQADTMVMWGGSRRLLAVFDSSTLVLRALLDPN